MNYEMADASKPEEIIAATQRAFITTAREVLKAIQKDSEAPGLTWDQIDYFLEELGKKQPTIINQNGAM